MLSPKPWKPETFINLVGALFLCFGLGSLAGYFLLQSERVAALGSEEFVSVLVGVIALQIPVFLVIAWFVRINRTTWREAFGFSTKGWKRLAVLSVATTVIGIGLTLTVTAVTDFFLRFVGVDDPAAQTTVTALKATVSIYQKVLFGVVAILVAPVVEELLFRGTVYPLVKHVAGKQTAIWATSVLFGIVHFNTLTFAALVVFSVLLILLYEETDNLLAPILSHALFNATNFAWLLYTMRSANEGI